MKSPLDTLATLKIENSSFLARFSSFFEDSEHDFKTTFFKVLFLPAIEQNFCQELHLLRPRRRLVTSRYVRWIITSY